MPDQPTEYEHLTADGGTGDEFEHLTAAGEDPPAETAPEPVDLSAMTDEELAAHVEDVRARLATGLDDAATPVDDLESLAGDLDAAQAEVDTRAEAAEADQARREVLRARITPVEPEDEVVTDPEAAPEAIAAAATPITRQGVLITTPPAPARRPAVRAHRAAPPAPSGPATARLTALPGNGHFEAGAELDIDRLATVLSDRLNRAQSGGATEWVARLSGPTVPEHRKFGPGRDNLRLAEEMVAGGESMTAAGGLCGLLTPINEVVGSGSPANYRPVAKALPSRAADRGGFQLLPGPIMSDTLGASDIISEAEDTTGATAPCLAFTCATVRTFEVEKIPVCNVFGNMLGRTNPEMVRAWVQESQVGRDSKAEGRLLGGIRAASLVTTAGGGVGTWREYFARMAEISAAYRDNPRRRMPPMAPLVALAPQWLPAEWMADAARGGQNWEDIPSVAEIEDTLKSKLGISITWYADTPIDDDAGLLGANMRFPVQSAGVIVPFPVVSGTALFAPGTFGVADGGEQDFGVTRDAVSNAANNYSIMTEIFEVLLWLGPAGSSIWLEHTSCPSGTQGNRVTITCPI
jgi:hypothetical protein